MYETLSILTAIFQVNRG